MNNVRRQNRRSHVVAAFVAVLLVFILAGAAIRAQAQTFTDLHDFNSSAGDPYNFLLTKPAQGRDGNFYAESNSGGTGNGTLAKMTPRGTVSVILSFNGTDGSNALGGVTLGTDGNLYGETWNGGTSNQGITFKVTPAGVETALHNFINAGDGVNPANALVLGTDGNFYGTTNTAPDTIYKVSSSGVFKTLHTLSTADGTSGGQLSQGSDGNFYGGMNAGGANGYGTLFKMTPSGTFTVLHNFTGADGTIAAPGMVEAANGTFYGAGEGGGASNAGVVFKITSTGTYTLLHSLNGTSDGKQPSVLTLATDGNFYGVTVQGGSASCGTIFKLTAAGVFSVLHNFDNTHGCNAAQYLTESTNGLLYGVTTKGGAHGNGIFFSFDVGLKPFVSLMTTSGKVGSKVGILGQGFSSSSVVKFNGVKATTVTRSGTTFVWATVPAGATDGKVTVTTGSTKLTSPQTFIVHNSWGTGTAMPTARMGAAAGAIGSDIYVVGGYNVSSFLGVNEIYNREKNTWTTGAADPNPRGFAAYAVVNKKLYMFGGSNGSALLSVAEAYDPATNTWSTLASVPYVSETASAVADEDVIYVIGGQDNNGYLTNVQSYNTTTNTWTEEAPLLVAKAWSAVGLLGTTVVSADGSNSSSYFGDIEGYNATHNTWSELTPDPTPRNPGCYGAINGKMYVAGGDNGTLLTLNEAYNPKTKSWATLAPMPEGVYIGAASAEAGGRLYCFGGGHYQVTVYNYVQIYQP